MRINKKLWWIPIIGIIHIIRMGFKYNFYDEIENLSGKESLSGCSLHAFSIVVLILLFILIL